MDILTQGILGAALAQSVAKKEEKRRATWVGLFSGLIADADVLIQSSTDPLLTVEYHRHFTHSLFFIPFGAVIAAILLWPWLRRYFPFGRLYLFCFAGYSFSGFIDACTSYGTYLFWPFYDQRVAFHIISIIDPVFTLILLVAVILSYRKLADYSRYGLTLAACYLFLGYVQLQRADAYMQQIAASRGHEIERSVVKPTLGNLLLWRSIYLSDDHFYVDAIRLGIFTQYRLYAGGDIKQVVPQRDFPQLDVSSVLMNDILRFTEFSNAYVGIHTERPDVLADIRYSNVPNSLSPLWGIEMDLQQPDQHARYTFFRDLSKQKRQQFMAMLLKSDI